MEINVQEFIDQVMDGQFTQQSETVDDGQVTVATGIAAMAQAISQQQLAQFEWQVTVPEAEQPVSVRLETIVINLPLVNAKTISKIMDVNATAEVNVYLVCETPDINRSGLRIDKLASATALVDDADSVTGAAQQWIDEKLATVRDNIAAAKEEKD